MNVEEIQNFLKKNKQATDGYFKISLKGRNPIYGIFIDYKDASELGSKNFWRIVTFDNIEEWKKRKDISLSRIFSGQAFTKLSIEQITT